MDGMYILRTFTSWYSIGLNRMFSSENGESESDPSKTADVFDDLKDYATNYKTKDLWIDRSTCQITESKVPLTNEDPLEEVVIDAFLGIVEMLNTYHLGVVKKSEVVAELNLGELSFNKDKDSVIFMIKEVKIFPIQSQSESVYTTGSSQDGLSDPLNSTNLSNLANLTITNTTNSKSLLNNPEQVQLHLEVQKVVENMEKILSSGYYYSFDTELTNTMQNLHIKGCVPLSDLQNRGDKLISPQELFMLRNEVLYTVANHDFNWSYKISLNIPKRWVPVLVQGYIGFKENYIYDEKVEIILIGRRSTKRSGTRFVARGIDEDGNVGNFVESELRVRINNEKWYSFVQNRGSVPVFWEQINFTSPVNLYNYHPNFRSFSNHVAILNEYYKPCDHKLFVNLLDVKENEKILSESFLEVVDEYNSQTLINNANPGMEKPIELLHYNYNVNAKWSTHDIIINYILDNLNEQLNNIGYFDQKIYLSQSSAKTESADFTTLCESTSRAELGLQMGIVRTNCLDCLDRTNIFQWILGWVVFNKIIYDHYPVFIQNLDSESGNGTKDTREQLKANDVAAVGDLFFNIFTELWCDHGDFISVHYSGTPSTMSERVKQANTSINSLFHYSKTMVQRFYSSLFQDSQRQQIYNILSFYSYNFAKRDHPVIDDTAHPKRSLLNSKYYIEDPFAQEPEDEEDLLVLEEQSAEESPSDNDVSQNFQDAKDHFSDSDSQSTRSKHKELKASDSTIFDALNNEIFNKLGVASKSSIFPKEIKIRDAKARRDLIGEDLKIWVGSWNIGAHSVEIDDNLLNWVELKKVECDLYIFSFQEFVELNFINIATGRTDENKEFEFEKLIENMFRIATQERYFKLTSISMTGLYLVIFVKQGLKKYIHDVLNTNVKTGLNYNIGNKGCVGVRFKLFNYNLSFLNLHLNFGKNLNIGRIELIEYILNNSFKESNENMLEDDIFILGGDFNFQIQLEKPEVLTLLKNMEYTKLLNYDEFNMAKMVGIPILNKLYEPKINFQPTYKYKDGTKYYTTKRSPAWCDRIILGGKLFEKHKIKVLSYKRNDNLIVSDHRPVSSIILVDFNAI